ncbi:hypothetical protein AVEN_155933-1, partial [Araneus ventricosus]
HLIFLLSYPKNLVCFGPADLEKPHFSRKLSEVPTTPPSLSFGVVSAVAWQRLNCLPLLDRKGNEFYPRSRHYRFARDTYFRGCYALDRENNEFYPFRKGLSEDIRRADGYQTARLSNGLEMYPTDARRNEYYLIQNGKPILCRQHDGKPYFARSRRRIAQIPWTVSHEYVSYRESLVATRDAVGNTVYVCRSDLRETSAMSYFVAYAK